MPKKVVAFMGSPRKNSNTATLVQELLRGARTAGAETNLIHAADLNMKGCQGCYSCKMKEKPERRCILNDDMTPLYQEIETADAVVFGSPVYMGTMTAQLKTVIDRLYPYIAVDFVSPLPKGIKCALIFTQNQKDSHLFKSHFDMTAMLLTVFGFEHPEILVSIDTIGYTGDPGKIAVPESDKTVQRKKRHKEIEFPCDMKKAYDMGVRMVTRKKQHGEE